MEAEGGGGGGVGKGVGELRERVLPSGKIEQQRAEEVFSEGESSWVHGWEAESGHRQHQGRMAAGRTSTPVHRHRYARSLQDLQKVKPGSDSHLKVLHPWDY